MNIVVLTGPYGQKMSPESSCIEKYLTQLGESYNIQIVCPKAAGNNEAKYNEFTVHSISDFWNTIRVKSQMAVNNTAGIRKKCWKLLFNLVRARGYVLSYFRFPTRNAWLIKAYGRKLEEVNENEHIDVVISVGGLPCAHQAALNFKRKYPQTKWITYTLDPFTINDDVYENVIFKSKRRKRNHEMEAAFWENADWNIFTEELIGQIKDEFGDKKNNFICFPYVLSRPAIKEVTKHPHSGILTAVYAGALYQNIRNPRRMLEVMSKVEGVFLKLYTSGECDGIIREYVSEKVCLMGLVPRHEYLRIINQEADILINVANKMALMSPSKYFELLSTGLPIINFYTIKNTNYVMTERYPLGINIGLDEENAVKKVEEFCMSVKGKRLSFDEISNLFPENCLTQQLEQLRKCLDQN